MKQHATHDHTRTLQIELRGERPLLMHSSILADPLHPITKELASLTRKRNKTAADHEMIARVEWAGGLWLHDGMPCIPAATIESAFVEAAKTRKRGKPATAGFVCNGAAMLDYDGPTSVDELWADERFRLRAAVKINGGSRTIRTRPHFPEWKVVFEAECVPGLIGENEVVELFQVAGFCIGIGDWRPKHGLFSVKRLS